jgi:type I restriction enzyme S subunit
MQRQLTILSIGSTFKRINVADFKGLLVPLPPRAEQEGIWAYLDSTLRPVAVVPDQAEREISLIREYRTRLISDVVTGQLDVREAAAHLPDDESIVPDDAEPAVEEVDDTDEGEAA